MENFLIRLSDVTAAQQETGEDEAAAFQLNHIELTLEEGEWLNIVGRNGSGKSTLVKLLAGVRMNRLSGEVHRHPMLVRQGLSVPVVMQQPDASLIGSTPWEDVVLMLEQNGMEGALIQQAADRALRKLGLLERKSQAVQSLSGGQKQLAVIAGCLAVSAPLLILDEATAMLDPDASQLVIDQVKELNRQGVAVVWVTQRLAELQAGERVVAMDKGRILFDGQAEQFFERKPEKTGVAAAESGPVISVCERLGFRAPYVVETAWELERLGYPLTPIPLSPEALTEAVRRYAV